VFFYALKRTLFAVPLVLGILTLTFLLLHLAPGKPIDYYSPQISPEAFEFMRVNFGLDQPLHVQYWRWLTQFLRGNFGVSFSHARPVRDILLEAVPNTLQLALLALILGTALGVLIGIFQALKENTLFDHISTLMTLVLYSVPSFWLALMLITLFSLLLGWLPASHMRSIGVEGMGFFTNLVDRIKHLLMPTSVLGVAIAANSARFMRGSFLDVLRQDYITAARARGLSETRVIFKHALRNALLPIIAFLGVNFPFLVSGSVVVEYIFSWPGMGRVMVDAIFARDYPLILASCSLAAFMVVIGNLLADLLSALADPRIRLSR